MQFPQEIVHATDALGVPGFVLGQWPQEHFVAPERIGTVAFHQVIRGLYVELGLGHFLDLMAAGVFAFVIEDEFGVGVLRAPGFEGLDVELVGLDEFDVHVQTLSLVFFSLFKRHELVCALNAVNEVRTPEDHALVDHPLERFIETNPSAVKQELRPKAGVQEVSCRVFSAAHIQVDLPPII